MSIKTWIEKHRLAWIFIVVTIGILMGFAQGFISGATTERTFAFSAVYGVMLFLAEITIGGSGSN